MAEYIDREALWTAFEHEPFYDNADRDEIVLPKIDDFPAANVTPVVHGQWEESEDDWFGTTVYTCSKCREEFVLVEGTPEQNLWHYCPNCGAKMDIEDGGDNDAVD